MAFDTTKPQDFSHIMATAGIGDVLASAGCPSAASTEIRLMDRDMPNPKPYKVLLQVGALHGVYRIL